MQNLKIYFRNPFTDSRISNADKKIFGEDTIQRITLRNTGGDFDQLLIDTANCQTALFGGITSVESNRALQESRTYLVDQLIIAFSKRNSLLNKYFEVTALKHSVYLEFFPQGIQPFTAGIAKSNVEQRMQEMVLAVTNNTAAAGGPAVLAEYQNFLSQYNALRSDQLSKKGAVTESRSNRDQAEKDWDLQMYKNLLAFANMYPGEPEMLDLYMDQTILRDRQSSATDGRGRITGYVSSGGASLGGVKVHVVDGDINDVITDPYGNYKTQNIPTGTYQVIYSKDGYTTKTETIDVVDAGDTLGNTSLTDPTPEPVEEEEEG